MQVLVGDRAQGAQPLGAEEPALLEGAQQRRVGQQPRQLVASADAQAAQPAEVVEADVVDEGVVRVGAQHAGDAAAEPDRRVADADDPVAEVAGHGLGDESRRVGEVDDPGVRCQPGHPAGDVDGDRDGPQSVRDAARADRLLAEDALGERHPFVVGASLEAADADGGEHEVGAAQRLVEVGRGGDRRRVGHPGRLFRQHPGHRRQPVRVQVVQDDVSHAPLRAVPEERPVHERHPESAAAQHRQPHVRTLPSPAAALRPAPIMARPGAPARAPASPLSRGREGHLPSAR
ncbi:hypothetical protein RKD32_006308 [Streptomyces sp. SAI-195]